MDEKLFSELIDSVEEMDKIRRGKKRASRRTVVKEIKVAAVREQTGLSQTRFARLIGVSKRTVENWEQGRRTPSGPARALLKIVAKDPEGAIRALHG
jgi:putative transcriptional regulator